jgi:hypothetical protein
MRPPDNANRGAAQGSPIESLSSTLATKSTARLAEDADCQLVEVDRWLESLDVVALDALGGGSYSPTEALEFVLVGHGRIRRHLAFAVVS